MKGLTKCTRMAAMWQEGQRGMNRWGRGPDCLSLPRGPTSSPLCSEDEPSSWNVRSISSRHPVRAVPLKSPGQWWPWTSACISLASSLVTPFRKRCPSLEETAPALRPEPAELQNPTPRPPALSTCHTGPPLSLLLPPSHQPVRGERAAEVQPGLRLQSPRKPSAKSGA